MASRIDKLKNEIKTLLDEGLVLMVAWACQHDQRVLPRKLTDKEKAFYATINIAGRYQLWYSKSSAVVKQLLPDRHAEFIDLYYNAGSSKKLTSDNFRIINALHGKCLSRYQDGIKHEIAGMSSAMVQYNTQYQILKSAQERLDSSLYDMEKILQADLFDSELEAATELNKKGFSRAAGAMAGVVLEKHFETVIKAHALILGKKNPCINDYNQKLKDEGVFDVVTWRFIQHLGALRNLCDHNKGVEPKKEDIDELIAGVDKIMKTVA